jgi:hypothetical protein
LGFNKFCYTDEDELVFSNDEFVGEFSEEVTEEDLFEKFNLNPNF